MDRRAFIGLLAGSMASFCLDPEALLWTKTKTIFIPSVSEYDAILKITMATYAEAMADILCRPNALMEHLASIDGGVEVFMGKRITYPIQYGTCGISGKLRQPFANCIP